MDFFAPLDQYCERTAVGLWNEPFNLFSNLGFIIGGLLIFRALKSTHYKQRQPYSQLLATMMILIGIGSALFHSLANVWSMWADVIPIGVFVITYLILFFRYTAGASVQKTILLLGCFGLLTEVVIAVSDHQLANGGEAYFGTWVVLFGISCFYAGRRQAHNQWRIALATIAFTASLFLRTVDQKYCETWPIGTHVFWHLLNSVVLFLIASAYISERPRA
jgi:Ceramidase